MRKLILKVIDASGYVLVRRRDILWKGGSSKVSAPTLLQEWDSSRELYLCDTFEGMTPPQEVGHTQSGYTAGDLLKRDRKKSGDILAVAGIDEMRANMAATS